MQSLDGSRNRRLLVIDDNPSIHNDYRKILASDGGDRSLEDAELAFFGERKQTSEPHVKFRLESAYQGQEGVAKVSAALADRSPYAVAFVDMRMPPGWDGLTTIERLWAVDPDLQVVICTAYSDNRWSDICQRLGHTDQLLVLKKPFDHAELSQHALALTEKWHLNRLAKCRMEEMEEMVAQRTRHVQAAHRETESLLAAISSLLVGINEHGIVTRWNSCAESLIGLASSDAIGRPLSEIAIPWSDVEEADQFIEACKSGVTVKRTLRLTAHGANRVLNFSSYPVREDGLHRGLLWLGTDVTEQVQLEQQLRHAQKLESVGQLAAGVAHEINTPMQYIGDNLEFLQNKVNRLEPVLNVLGTFADREAPDADAAVTMAEMAQAARNLKVRSFLPEVTDAIADSRAGVKHVSRIVRAMKEFAHPEQEVMIAIDVNRALESTIAVSTNEWKQVAQVETSFDASLPLIYARAGEINQVLLNVLINAAHAIGEVTDEGAGQKGTISVSTRLSGDYVEIAISDTGCGIPENVKKRIFDPFFTTKEVGTGTGQGLSIAHAVVVQKHAGKLWCDSSPGSGTTFYIQLPVEPPTEEPAGEQTDMRVVSPPVPVDPGRSTHATTQSAPQ